MTMTFTELIAHFEQASSEEELIAAVQALGSSHNPESLPYLIKSFGFNQPAVADAALAEVLQFREAAVDPLLNSIDSYDYGARAYSTRALAQIGDPRAFEFLSRSIQEDFAPSVRRAAVRGLGSVVSKRPESDQKIAMEQLIGALDYSDWGLRYAAICGLVDLYRRGIQREWIHTVLNQVSKDQDPLIRVKAITELGSLSE